MRISQHWDDQCRTQNNKESSLYWLRVTQRCIQNRQCNVYLLTCDCYSKLVLRIFQFSLQQTCGWSPKTQSDLDQKIWLKQKRTVAKRYSSEGLGKIVSMIDIQIPRSSQQPTHRSQTENGSVYRLKIVLFSWCIFGLCRFYSELDTSKLRHKRNQKYRRYRTKQASCASII